MAGTTYLYDVADDTFVVADPSVVAAAVADPPRWQEWWPDLDPVVSEQRGSEGLRWRLAGPVRGSMEIWLEPWGDGTILHWYLRVERDPRVAATDAGRCRARRTRSWKRHVHALKDRLEADREAGTWRVVPAAQPPVAVVKDLDEPAETPTRGSDDRE